jgi:hypothetical protein
LLPFCVAGGMLGAAGLKRSILTHEVRPIPININPAIINLFIFAFESIR